MGNLMIGAYYPPFLGAVSKIYCGEQQCWPKNDKQKGFYLEFEDTGEKVLIYPTWWEEGVTAPPVGSTQAITFENSLGETVTIYCERRGTYNYKGETVDRCAFYFEDYQEGTYQYSGVIHRSTTMPGIWRSDGNEVVFINCPREDPDVICYTKQKTRLFRVHATGVDGVEKVVWRKVGASCEIVVNDVVAGYSKELKVPVVMGVTNSPERWSSRVIDTGGWSYKLSGTTAKVYGTENYEAIDLYITLLPLEKFTTVHYVIYGYKTKSDAENRRQSNLEWKEEETIITSVPISDNTSYSNNLRYCMPYSADGGITTTVELSSRGKSLLNNKRYIVLSYSKSSWTTYGQYWDLNSDWTISCSNPEAMHVGNAGLRDCYYEIICYPKPPMPVFGIRVKEVDNDNNIIDDLVDSRMNEDDRGYISTTWKSGWEIRVTENSDNFVVTAINHTDKKYRITDAFSSADGVNKVGNTLVVPKSVFERGTIYYSMTFFVREVKDALMTIDGHLIHTGCRMDRLVGDTINVSNFTEDFYPVEVTSDDSYYYIKPSFYYFNIGGEERDWDLESMTFTPSTEYTGTYEVDPTGENGVKLDANAINSWRGGSVGTFSFVYKDVSPCEVEVVADNSFGGSTFNSFLDANEHYQRAMSGVTEYTTGYYNGVDQVCFSYRISTAGAEGMTHADPDEQVVAVDVKRLTAYNTYESVDPFSETIIMVRRGEPRWIDNNRIYWYVD